MPLADVIGHGHVRNLLRQAVAKGRVPQSLLFAGPDGVGKRAVAVALAQALNCPSRTDGDACGRCPTCQRISHGTHSDVVLLDRGDEASIKIKALRERVLDLVGYRPFEGARRVFIIDPADDLTTEAQDALLKTLEEPPPSVVLILIASSPDTLLPTIQSRCRRLRFGPLSETDVAAVLIDRLAMPAARARSLAAASGGSVQGALAQEDDAAAGDREAALAVLRAARQASVGPRLKASTALAQHGSKRRDREALGARLAALASLTRDLGVMAASSPVPLANLDLEDALRDVAAAFPADRIDAAFESIGSARRALDRNASPKIVADWVAIHL
ncbi:MAG TPA: DNA polymerase III subunit delta' [Vicinamibacterales bacterium]|nr:DNA polymerase III subunit delta' [Vicinamibacterales bacterium]